MKKITLVLLLICSSSFGQRNYLNEGNRLLGQEKNKEAETVFRDALNEDKDNVIYQTQLALSLLNQGKHEEAQKILDNVLNKDDKNVAALWYSGINQFMNTNDFKKSVEYFETAFPLIPKISPQYFAVNFFIGKSYKNLLHTKGLTYSQTSRMLETLKEYVRLQPNAEDAAYLKSFVERVEKNRPGKNVQNWVIANSEAKAAELIEEELKK